MLAQAATQSVVPPVTPPPVVERLLHYAMSLPPTEPLAICASESYDLALYVKLMLGVNQTFPRIETILDTIQDGRFKFCHHMVCIL